MIYKPNLIIRELCKQYGVPLWALAQRLGISENALIRKMRIEFDNKRKEELIGIIQTIARESFIKIDDGSYRSETGENGAV